MPTIVGGGATPSRTPAPRPAPQALLALDVLYGAGRAGIMGNPLIILLLLSWGGGDDAREISLLWSYIGSLFVGMSIVIATFMVARGSVRARRALVVLTALDLCSVMLLLVPALDAGGSYARRWAFSALAAALAVALLNYRYLWRAGGAPARAAAPPSPAVAPHRPAVAAAHPPAAARPITAGLGWVYLLAIAVMLAWHWGVPFADTANAARRGAEAGRRQSPPHIDSVWVLPTYDRKVTSWVEAPADIRPAGMDFNSYRPEYGLKEDAATVQVYGDGFLRVASREAGNRDRVVAGDGRPLVLDQSVWYEDAEARFQVSPSRNAFLFAGQHALQVVSGTSAKSDPVMLDLGTPAARAADWIGDEPRIHHVAAVGYQPGKVTLELLISGQCRPMPGRPGWCTTGFQPNQGPNVEIPCTVTVFGLTENCRGRHPNILDAEAIYGTNQDATGTVQIEIAGRTSQPVEIRVRDLIAPWVANEPLSHEYQQGLVRAPAAAEYGPAGLLAHLVGPALAIGLFLLLRGWRGQVIFKTVAALTLPTLLASVLIVASIIPLAGVKAAWLSPILEAIERDIPFGFGQMLQGAVIGLLIGLCIDRLNRTRTA